MGEQPANSCTASEALLNYIQKGFPIAPKWSIIACLVLLAIFVFIGTQDAQGAAWVNNFNSFAASTVQSWRNPALTQVMCALSVIGSELGSTLIALALVVWLAIRRRWDDFLYCLGNYAVFLAISQGAKFIFCTPRPVDQAIVELPLTFSYPSGHSGTSLMLAFIISMLAIVYFRKRGKSDTAGIVIMVVLVLLALCVALSRVYLGVHWGIDLIGGWCVALAWGLPTFTWFVGQYPPARFQGGSDPYGVKAIQEKRAGGKTDDEAAVE
ncbi:MAG: phosphatase PAP2 family protein [Coriobacteriia bacterium]|nr:phosphatase PAP2 family protein [Coriobacteriia bacterium]